MQQKGTVDHTPVYVREVVKRALELSATAIVLVHNHPSGDPTPARADIEMTKQIVSSAKNLGIVVHDYGLTVAHRCADPRIQQQFWLFPCCCPAHALASMRIGQHGSAHHLLPHRCPGVSRGVEGEMVGKCHTRITQADRQLRPHPQACEAGRARLHPERRP